MSPTTTPNGGKNGTRGKGEGLPLSLFFVGSRRDGWCVTHQKLWRGGSHVTTSEALGAHDRRVARKLIDLNVPELDRVEFDVK